MKFRTRITLGYTALALAVSLGLGIFYNMYIVQKYETSAVNKLGILSEQVINNLDGNIQKMTQVTLSLLSDQDAVQTIRELSVDMADPGGHVADIINGKARIKSDLYTAYNLENFYRVVVFNRYGYIAASATMQERYVDADRMNVRSGPGTNYGAVGVLTDNAQVTVISETYGNDGHTWYQISYGNGQTGYARSDYIEQQVIYSASDSNFENWMNQQGFPESYKNGLRGLHQKYPNWVFTAQHTGLDWNTIITEESKVGRNLVGRESISSWKSTADGAFDWAADSWPGFDGSAWNAASSEIIAHYMDPRNFLDEEYIFQFEQQSYNASTQTRDGLMQLISGTFLDNEVVVPVNGSSVQAGTVIENNGYGYADKTYGFLGGTPGNAGAGTPVYQAPAGGKFGVYLSQPAHVGTGRIYPYCPGNGCIVHSLYLPPPGALHAGASASGPSGLSPGHCQGGGASKGDGLCPFLPGDRPGMGSLF